MKIIELTLDQLKPYERNPRRNDHAVKYVAQSIKEFGFKVPIIIDKDNVIVAGHTRYKAAKKLGMKKVPCIIADDLTDEQIKAFRLADNKVTEIAEWDFDLLEIELEGIANINMSEFGFEVFEEEPQVIEDNYEINIPKEPKTKMGEIYQLGPHRLMVGDSTNQRDVDRLMGDELADLLYTDPPYNVNISNSQGMQIENDDMDSEKFKEFLQTAFECASNSLKDGGGFYIWHGDCETVNFRTACEENGMMVKQCLIWVKQHFTLGRQDYKWIHEPCLYGWKRGAAHYFVEEFNHLTVIEDNVDLNKLTKAEMKKMLEDILGSDIPTTIFKENRPIKSDLHPTMKPLKLCGDMIRNSTKKDEIVLDLFGGSGSTLIACQQLQRVCYMMEYDPRYADVIIERWETFTGQKAKKL